LRDLSDRLNSLPGVRAASFSMGASPLQTEDDLYFWIEGQPKPESTSEMHMALVYRVEPGYLTAMGIPLKQGRFFTNHDDEKSPDVVVIDEVFARQYFSNTDPLGKRVNLRSDRGPAIIVGVVGHVNQWSLDANDKESLQAQIYEPFRQLDGGPSRVGVVMRTESGKPGEMPIASIRRAVQGQNSQNIIFGVQTMNEVIADSLARHRFSMMLLNSFAAAALLLASIGLYGVISYLVGQRTQELGVRIALGARRGDILRLVLNHGMKMALGGMAIGLIASFGLTRLLADLLFGVSATDPVTYAAITSILTAVAIVASLVPAWRATKVDPLVALRND